jgi:sulfonate transport system substrate-binding protein
LKRTGGERTALCTPAFWNLEKTSCPPTRTRAFIPRAAALQRLSAIALGALAFTLGAAPAQAQETAAAHRLPESRQYPGAAQAHGALEKRLQPLGVEVKWAEFAAGPQLLEALNVGSVDFGYVGEAPPVFAQAAGADFVYTAYEIPTPDAEGLLVQKDSPIKSVAELKGKKIAFNKGSTCLVVALLKKAACNTATSSPSTCPGRCPRRLRARCGRCLGDLGSVPGRRRKAGRRTSPGLGCGRGQPPPVLPERTSLRVKNPQVQKILLEEITREGEWVRTHTAEAAAQLAPIQGLDADIIQTGLKRYAHVYKPVDAQVLAEQQKIADAFFELKLIPSSSRSATPSSNKQH